MAADWARPTAGRSSDDKAPHPLRPQPTKRGAVRRGRQSPPALPPSRRCPLWAARPGSVSVCHAPRARARVPGALAERLLRARRGVCLGARGGRLCTSRGEGAPPEVTGGGCHAPGPRCWDALESRWLAVGDLGGKAAGAVVPPKLCFALPRTDGTRPQLSLHLPVGAGRAGRRGGWTPAPPPPRSPLSPSRGGASRRGFGWWMGAQPPPPDEGGGARAGALSRARGATEPDACGRERDGGRGRAERVGKGWVGEATSRGGRPHPRAGGWPKHTRVLAEALCPPPPFPVRPRLWALA